MVLVAMVDNVLTGMIGLLKRSLLYKTTAAEYVEDKRMLLFQSGIYVLSGHKRSGKDTEIYIWKNTIL